MTNPLKLKDDIILNSRHHSAKILLDARYIENNRKKPIIIFIHGFKGFKDWGHFNIIANEMAKQNFVYVKMNLSHNGTTPDHPIDFVDLKAFSENNFSIELDDIGTVIDYLWSTDCAIDRSDMDLDRIYLLGHSRGGGLALLKANEDSRIKAVTTWSAVADFKLRWPDEVLEEWKTKGINYIDNSRTKQKMPMKYQIVEDYEAHEKRLSVPGAVKNLNIPLLIIHGTDDETIHHDDALMIHELYPSSELFLIDGANHVMGASHPFKGHELPEDSKKALKKTIQFFNHRE